TRTVFFLFGLVFLIWMLVQLRSVVVQVLLAVILAAGMTPLVDRFTAEEAVERWRWRPPRALVVLVFYLVLIALIVLVGLLVFPPVLVELEDLASRLPDYVASSQIWVQELSSRYPFIPQDLDRSI